MIGIILFLFQLRLPQFIENPLEMIASMNTPLGMIVAGANLAQGNILKKLVLFMVPIFGALVLQAMYGAVDLIIVGWFGTTAGISAVSTGSNLVNLVVFTVTGLSLGITVLIRRYIGEKKQERKRKEKGGVF